MAGRYPPLEDQQALIEQLRRMRRWLCTTSAEWPRRSGLRRGADAVIDELDELARVITGDRAALLDKEHRTP